MSQAPSSSRTGTSPLPLRLNGPNTLTKVLDTTAGRILCIADIRGRLSHLNQLAKEYDAKAIIHTGDFGFYETSSLERINDRTLRHLLMYSPLIQAQQRNQLLSDETSPAQQRQALHDSNLELLTEFPKLLTGNVKLSIPVFTVWGACEDVTVIEKFRMGVYEIDNLHVLDEATTRCLDVGGVKLRLLGLGGALVLHKLFDNGDGQATIAGGGGTMWTTALQIGELVDTAQRVYDPTETRLLVTHASPGRDGLMAQLALITRADLTISGGLHFRYATSYNEFSVQGDVDGYRNKILRGKEALEKVWESVKTQVEGSVDEQQRILLEKFLSVVERVPPASNTAEEPSWKNCWNWNLCDAAYGALLFDIREGRISAELKSQGFNYAYRRSATTGPPPQNANQNAVAPPPANTTSAPAAAPSPKPVQSEAKTPGSEALSPVTEPQTNGHAQQLSPAAIERAEQKKRERKEKEREKKERIKAEKEKERAEREKQGGKEKPDGKTHTPKGSGKATPIPSGTSTPPTADASSKTENINNDAAAATTNTLAAADSSLAAESPSATSPANSTGIRTPTSRRPKHHPWTLFVKLPAPTSDEELRAFFQEAQGGITKITMPPSTYGRGRTAFVEFGDEDAMKEGLSKHAEKLKDQPIQVKIAEERPFNPNHHHNRGGHHGSNRGAGFASRGFQAAGLTRGRSTSSGHNNASSPAPAASEFKKD